MSTIDPTAALALLATQKTELANVISHSKGGPLASAKNAEATREKIVTALTPAPTPTPTPTPIPTGTQPTGIPGNWNLVFDDEFAGTSLDASKWYSNGYKNNGMTSSSVNVTVANGIATLILASKSSGAQIRSIAQPLIVGGAAEARVWFKGNWDAFWASGALWPQDGEIDCYEDLGIATCNTHWGTGNGTQSGPFDISGTWTDDYHVYGLRYTSATSVDIYWDGKLVKTMPIKASGKALSLLVTNGVPSGNPKYGAAGATLVDYVRAWAPA